jgi:hypothetical protein
VKTAVISSAAIRGTVGLRLDAEHYVDPTATVDAEIAAAERALARVKVRLKGLHAKRQRILDEGYARLGGRP